MVALQLGKSTTEFLIEMILKFSSATVQAVRPSCHGQSVTGLTKMRLILESSTVTKMQVQTMTTVLVEGLGTFAKAHGLWVCFCFLRGV